MFSELIGVTVQSLPSVEFSNGRIDDYNGKIVTAPDPRTPKQNRKAMADPILTYDDRHVNAIVVREFGLATG